MKIYIAGPMAGIGDRNFPAFHAAAKWLRDHNWEVLSPAELNVEFLGKGRAQCMRRDIEFVMQAEAIALLPGWERSQGALCELAVAQQLGLKIFLYSDVALDTLVGDKRIHKFFVAYPDSNQFVLK